MKSRVKRIILFLFCCLLAGAVSGQNLSLRTYSVNDGLASSSIMSIIQDRRGYLWIGTQHGMSRFDGLEYTNYFIQDGLPHMFVWHVFEDRDGNIWAGTLGGLAKIWEDQYHHWHIKSYTTADGLCHRSVYFVTQSADGSIWCGTKGGLSRYDGEKFHSFTMKTHNLPSNEIHSIAFDKLGNMWLGTSGGVSCYSHGEFVNYGVDDGLISNRVRNIMCDRDNNIWIGTENGLSIWKNGKIESFKDKPGLAPGWVEAFCQDRSGNIWIGTLNGVSLYKNGTFTTYNSSHGFPNEKFYAICQDREKNIWFGTIRGLTKLHYLRFHTFTTRHGLPDSYVWSTTQDRSGNLWFGTENGLSRYSNGRFKNFDTSDGLAHNTVYEIIAGKKGNLWCGTLSGVSKYSPASGKFQNFTTKQGLPSNIIPGLGVDHKGVIWVGTVEGLCLIIDNRVTGFPLYRENKSVGAFMEDRGRNMWFASSQGLFRVSADRQSIQHFSLKDGLPNTRIYSLYQDSKGNIWISTLQGLSCFRDGKFVNYYDSDGLLENTCYFVLEDDSGILWIGTGRGLNRFDGETFRSYTLYDGLPSTEMVDDSCFKDRDGNLWFGTNDGVARFYSKQDPINHVPPPIYISRFEVMEKEFPFSKDNEFDYSQNNININFLGISFGPPEAVKYRYRLHGIDKEWKETRERTVSYPYLPSGDYYFQVVALNKDGTESPAPKNIRFRILPPFWKSWWFQLITVLVVLLVVVGILFWRIKRTRELVLLQERNKQLVMAQKMELLGILAGGAVHDLKNLLAVIIAYSKIAGELVKENTEEVEEQPDPKRSNAIEKIKSTALTAVQVVKQILAFTKQNYDTTIAANLPDLVDDILEILMVSTPEEVTISWEPPDREIRLYINPTRLQQVVMNLCLNAIQAMPDGGTLTIRLYKQEERKIILEVSDTGMGMSPDITGKIFDPLFTTKRPDKGTGLGLFVVKQIVEEYNGTIQVQSVPSQGSTFIITFQSDN